MQVFSYTQEVQDEITDSEVSFNSGRGLRVPGGSAHPLVLGPSDPGTGRGRGRGGGRAHLIGWASPGGDRERRGEGGREGGEGGPANHIELLLVSGQHHNAKRLPGHSLLSTHCAQLARSSSSHKATKQESYGRTELQVSTCFVSSEA